MKWGSVYYWLILVIILASGTVLLWKSVSVSWTDNYFAPTNYQIVKTIDKSSPHQLLFVGDIMLGRNVETLSAKNSYYPFEKIGQLFDGANQIVGNLEGPIPVIHKQTPIKGFGFSFPVTAVSALQKARVGVVSLANNHTTDQGALGYQETRRVLEDGGISTFGHPTEISRLTSVSRILVGKCSLFIVGINATFPSFDKFAAEELVQSLGNERDTETNAMCPHENILVYIHWGEEYQPTSNIQQQNLAHFIIDSGADLIIGSHPHVVQEIENYNGKYILYSLGNFIFDQYFSEDVGDGLAVRIQISEDSGKITALELLPTKSIRSQPAPMEEADRMVFLISLAKKSSANLRTRILNGTISEFE